MLSIPASSHFFGHFFRVEPEERSDFGAVAAQKEQFAPFPVLPSRPVNAELASRFARRPAVLAPRLEQPFTDGCRRRERIVVEER